MAEDEDEGSRVLARVFVGKSSVGSLVNNVGPNCIGGCECNGIEHRMHTVCSARRLPMDDPMKNSENCY
eukprot:875295-Rhodomonas_salina.1